MKTKPFYIIAIFAILLLSCGQNDKPSISNDALRVEKLDESTYEIINLKTTPVVSNYYVLIKFSDKSKERVNEFLEKFRRQYCVNKCNISIYDTKDILPLINKYPLDKQEYIQIAEHLIASTSFDSPDVVLWYPYQDSQYEEYGGKNWKKEHFK